MSYVSNYLQQLKDPTFNEIKEFNEEDEYPDRHLQEKYIQNILAKLNNRVIGTREFLTLHNEDQFMYPELGFDIKRRKPKTILKKILGHEYKSEIPAFSNKYLQNRLLKKNKYGTSSLLLPSSKPPPSDKNNPFDKLVYSKTSAPKTKNKKIYTSIDALNNKERGKLFSDILGNDIVDISTNHPQYAKILPEIILESDVNLNRTDNELIHNYFKKIEIDKDIEKTDDITLPFLDKKPEIET